MNTYKELDEALRSDQPLLCLRDIVQQLLAQGKDGQVITEELEQFRTVLRAVGRDTDEDIVLEVMDFLAGWCSPHMKLPAGERSQAAQTGDGEGEEDGGDGH